jgi:lysophospholipase L1-like esterase
LTLNPDSVPLIVGEVVNKDHQGVCSVMNEVIDTVPDVIPNSYVAKSDGLPCREDHLHFTAAGYRELGERYAAPMLKLLGK